VIRGDSTYWEIIPPGRTSALFSAFLSSADSLGSSPAPTNFYFIQRLPFLQNGSLAAGQYDLAPTDSTALAFSFSYPGGHDATTDSGVATIDPPTGDSTVVGTVSAWMHEYRPAIGSAFHVTGQFRIVTRH
jgi:hypothetical protein